MKHLEVLTGLVLGAIIGVYFTSQISPFLWLLVIAGVVMGIRLIQLK